MINLSKLSEFVEENEGYRELPYRCSRGKLTIGIGRNIQDVGITRKEALYLLKNDLSECLSDLGRIFVDQEIPDNKLIALADMRFNLGPQGFRRFKELIIAVRAEDWEAAAEEAEDSIWYDQVGDRGPKIVKLLLS